MNPFDCINCGKENMDVNETMSHECGPIMPKEIYCKRSNLNGISILPTVLMKTQETPKEGYEKYIHESHHSKLLAEAVKESRSQAFKEAITVVNEEILKDAIAIKLAILSVSALSGGTKIRRPGDTSAEKAKE